MTTFALYALYFLLCNFIGWRVASLFIDEQSPAGRIADCLIIAFYAACIVGLWPLTWGALS